MPQFLKASRSFATKLTGYCDGCGRFGGRGELVGGGSVLFGPAVGLHLLVVLLETDREAGVAGGVADEVEVVGLGGVQGGAQRLSGV